MVDTFDFGSEFAQTYTEKCDNCGKEISLSTQRDEGPEYYTDVFVKCSCGQSVLFVIPVN